MNFYLVDQEEKWSKKRFRWRRPRRKDFLQADQGI